MEIKKYWQKLILINMIFWIGSFIVYGGNLFRLVNPNLPVMPLIDAMNLSNCCLIALNLLISFSNLSGHPLIDGDI